MRGLSRAWDSVFTSTKPHLQAEEALGYLVEQNPNMPIAKRFLAWFRAQVRRLTAPLKGAEKLRFIKWATDLTADDLIYMATAATREVTSMPTAQQDTRKSSKQPTTIEIDGKPIAPAVRDNQGRLLAPNGQPSKLNERQWHQVRTSEFKAWLGIGRLPHRSLFISGHLRLSLTQNTVAI